MASNQEVSGVRVPPGVPFRLCLHSSQLARSLRAMTTPEQNVIGGLFDDLLLTDIDAGQELAGFMVGSYGFAAIAVRYLDNGLMMLVQDGCDRFGQDPDVKLYVVDVLRCLVGLVRSYDAGVGDLRTHWRFMKLGGSELVHRAALNVAEEGWGDIANSATARRLAELIMIGRSPRLFDIEQY